MSILTMKTKCRPTGTAGAVKGGLSSPRRRERNGQRGVSQLFVFCNNALLEAMKSGIPPIVADVAHADLVVEHNVSGLVVKKDNALWEKAIISLLADEDFRLRLAKGARQKVAKDFDEAARANRLEAIYQSKIWR